MFNYIINITFYIYVLEVAPPTSGFCERGMSMYTTLKCIVTCFHINKCLNQVRLSYAFLSRLVKGKIESCARTSMMKLAD